jgi:Ca2+-binding EF-hand superfamily protein
MLSVETKHNIREFLQTIGDYELSIEQLRQRLAANPDFEPYAAFLRLDKGQMKNLSPEDLLIFLHENDRPHYTLRDCQYVINYFDIDQDGTLSYTEFMQMVLPCDNLQLRSEASQR